MKVKIFYKCNCGCDADLGHVAKEVFVKDGMTGKDIAEWFEKRHSHIHLAGVTVTKICKYWDSNIVKNEFWDGCSDEKIY